MNVETPGSTAKTYRSAAQKFSTWLHNQTRYPTDKRMIVTEEKLLVYLHTEVGFLAVLRIILFLYKSVFRL